MPNQYIKFASKLIFPVLVVASISVFAQDATPIKPPSIALGNSINYIRTWDALAPESNSTNLLSRPVSDVKRTTNYMDGLGRPIQTVIKQGSLKTGNSHTDFVTPFVYDEFGRVIREYLPFGAIQVPSATGSLNDGNLKLNVFDQQQYFYSDNNVNSPVKTQGETFYYSKTDFELSPLNRLEKIFAAGNSWVNAGRAVITNYWTNTTIDDVKKWTVSPPAGGNLFGTYAVSGDYAAADLYKSVLTDEHGKQTIEFKDREGKIILKKVQLTATADNGTGSNYTGWLCTYYIYDHLKQLRCVIQPRGVELIAGPWVLTDATLLAEQCFRYEYDDRGRMTRKKVPGAGEVSMVYDQWDRPVLTQDANLKPQNKWVFTKYDQLNRPVMTGFYINTTHTTQQTMQNYVNTQNMGRFEVYTPAASPPMYTLNQSFPVVVFADVETLNYYDDYDWTNGIPSVFRTFDNSFNAHFYAASSSTWPFPQAMTPTNNTRGLLTGGIVRVPGTTLLATTTFYDENGKVIQTKAENITGGCDISTTQYSFSGNPLVTVLRQDKAGTNAHSNTIITRMTYDNLGRLIITEKKTSSSLVNSGGIPANWTVILENTYDELGRVISKTIGNKKDLATGAYISPRAPLQALVFDFNIRGWLLGMNRDYLVTEGQTGDGKYFGYELGYDKLANKAGRNFAGTAQFGGNLRGLVWKSDGDDIRRKYDYTYDATNRLLRADFEQQNAADHAWNNTLINFSVIMGDGTPTNAYDANGNIKRMQQWGVKLNISEKIDDLQYNYITNTGKLSSIVENAAGGTLPAGPETGLGDFTDKNTAGSDYGYDMNGNMISDLNKRMNGTTGNNLTSGGAITYNHMNLPLVVTVKKSDGSTRGTVTYLYDAAGMKLKKTTQELNATVAYNGTNYTSNITTTTTYLGESVCESKSYSNASLSALNYTDLLQFIGHEAGRTRYKAAVGASPAKFEYDYFIKDHLGNVRMILTEELQQDIYPAATLEGNPALTTSAVYIEKKYYNITDAYIVSKSQATGITDYVNKNGGSGQNDPPVNNNPNSSSTANSASLYKTNATTNKTGLGVTLKVMAGDQLSIFGRSYWFNSGGNFSTKYPLPVTGLLDAFIGTPSMVGKGLTSGGLNTSVLGAALGGYMTRSDNPGYSAPHAYVNWVFFDEQFNYAGGGFDRVGGSGTVKIHNNSTIPTQTVPKNGYVFVFCSNESQYDVFFDNLQLIHTRGSLLEEAHYYPFGLTMAAISTQGAGTLANEERTFQAQRFDDDLDLNWIPFKWRVHDPQTGRFLQVDPLAEDYRYQSAYNFSENRVTDGIELEGLEYVAIHHFADGTVHIKEYYKMTDKEIEKEGGTTSGTFYNSAAYGPLGKGVVHYYYNEKSIEPSKTIWEQRQTDFNSDMMYHGLYSGPGCITYDGKKDYAWWFQPIDWSDAIAKRHDMDYARLTATGEEYAGFVEDVRTLQADLDMVRRVMDIQSDMANPFRKNGVDGVETPWRTSSSGEMENALAGQKLVINSLAIYKKWKIDHKKGNKDKFKDLKEQFAKDQPIVAAIIELIYPD
jgi:RHS repeat-associated protein